MMVEAFLIFAASVAAGYCIGSIIAWIIIKC